MTNKSHGMRHTVEYSTWCNIKARCYNPKNSRYEDYGGRGIKVCDRWLNSFNNFYEDMGKRPSKEFSIDRIDNNSDYCPENCRWATKLEQSSNKRNTLKLEYDGRIYSAKELAIKANLSYRVFVKRLEYMSIKDAVEQPLQKIYKKRSE